MMQWLHRKDALSEPVLCLGQTSLKSIWPALQKPAFKAKHAKDVHHCHLLSSMVSSSSFGPSVRGFLGLCSPSMNAASAFFFICSRVSAMKLMVSLMVSDLST